MDDGHTLKIEGYYVFRQGGKVVAEGKNKLTGDAIINLANLAYYRGFGGTSLTGGSLGTMRVGTGSGSTTSGTTALVAEDATAPNTVQILADSPSGTQHRTKMVATWNAGTLSAITVREAGVKGNAMRTIAASTVTANTLLSRLSASDGEFSEFVVNTGLPLTLEYRLTFTWA